MRSPREDAASTPSPDKKVINEGGSDNVHFPKAVRLVGGEALFVVHEVKPTGGMHG